MKIVRRHARDFSIASGFEQAGEIYYHKNQGERQYIQWMFVLSGSVSIKYNLNGFDGSYHLTEDSIGDLSPTKNLETEWHAGSEGYSFVAFMSSDQEVSYESELLDIDKDYQLTPEDKERIIVNLGDPLDCDGKILTNSNFIRLSAGKSCTLKPVETSSDIVIFRKNGE